MIEFHLKKFTTIIVMNIIFVILSIYILSKKNTLKNWTWVFLARYNNNLNEKKIK